MALIYCKHCGKMVSDKAKACPHCGTPVEANGAPDNATPETQNTAPEAPVVHYVKPERNNNTMLIALIVMGVVALLGICGWLWYDNQQKRAELERQLAEQVEQARQDSIAAAELREQLRQDSIAKAKKQEQIDNIYNEYVKVLKQHGYGGYFLFDITKDGVPELWVDAFNRAELEEMYEWPDLHVFTIKNDKVVKLSDIDGCGTYFQGNDYIIGNWNWKGDDFRIIKFTYSSNRIIEKVIRTYSWEEEDNIHISEPKIIEPDITDFESLKKQIQSYFPD